MVDSTEARWWRRLSWIGGRAVLNSVNLEEGDEPGTRLDSFLTWPRSSAPPSCAPASTPRARPARPTGRCGPPRAIHDIAVERYGLAAEDLLFDALALPLSTGMEESRKDGIETIEGIRRIKAELPGVSTILGLSNVSFGLNPPPARCSTRSSSTSASRPGSTRPSCTPRRSCRCRRSTSGRRRSASTSSTTVARRLRPLQELLALFEGVRLGRRPPEDHSDWPVEQRLEQRIIDGDRNGLEADLDRGHEPGPHPLAIINDFLLAGMKTVGERSPRARCNCPSSSVGRDHEDGGGLPRALTWRRPTRAARAPMVLATVKGDVHDIGKNLVDIILTNNGYTVKNLGIKVGINDMVAP
jgi:5-methyltetrahydrofolate--homocysteine methyltransferase